MLRNFTGFAVSTSSLQGMDNLFSGPARSPQRVAFNMKERGSYQRPSLHDFENEGIAKENGFAIVAVAVLRADGLAKMDTKGVIRKKRVASDPFVEFFYYPYGKLICSYDRTVRPKHDLRRTTASES